MLLEFYLLICFIALTDIIIGQIFQDKKKCNFIIKSIIVFGLIIKALYLPRMFDVATYEASIYSSLFFISVMAITVTIYTCYFTDFYDIIEGTSEIGKEWRDKLLSYILVFVISFICFIPITLIVIAFTYLLKGIVTQL